MSGIDLAWSRPWHRLQRRLAERVWAPAPNLHGRACAPRLAAAHASWLVRARARSWPAGVRPAK